MISHPPPPVKVASKREREYLRPLEVEAMIKAAHSFGRHGVRDAAIILLMFWHGPSHIKRFGDYLIDLDAIPPAFEETLNLGF
jgi:hypothetical protein